jgi:hypothetical protein
MERQEAKVEMIAEECPLIFLFNSCIQRGEHTPHHTHTTRDLSFSERNAIECIV